MKDTEFERSTQSKTPKSKGFKTCCAMQIAWVWAQAGGSMNVVHYETQCPGCGQYIGITQTSENEAKEFLQEFGLKYVQ